MRFVNDRIQLRLRQLRRIHGIRQRQNSAGGAGFDNGRPILMREAHGVARLVRTIDDAFFRTSLLAKDAGAKAGFVAVTTGGADGVHADQHARSRNDAFVDGVAQADVEIVLGADVTHGGEAGHERDARVDGGIDGLFRDGELQALEHRFGVVLAVLHGEVRVGVDESGKQCGVAEIDDLCVSGDCGAGADGGDFAAGDDDQTGGREGVALAVKHARSLEYIRLGAGLLRANCGGKHCCDHCEDQGCERLHCEFSKSIPGSWGEFPKGRR